MEWNVSAYHSYCTSSALNPVCSHNCLTAAGLFIMSSASMMRGVIPALAPCLAYQSYSACECLSVSVALQYRERGRASGFQSRWARNMDGNISMGCRIWKMGCSDRRRLSGTDVGFV